MGTIWYEKSLFIASASKKQQLAIVIYLVVCLSAVMNGRSLDLALLVAQSPVVDLAASIAAPAALCEAPAWWVAPVSLALLLHAEEPRRRVLRTSLVLRASGATAFQLLLRLGGWTAGTGTAPLPLANN